MMNIFIAHGLMCADTTRGQLIGYNSALLRRLSDHIVKQAEFNRQQTEFNRNVQLAINKKAESQIAIARLQYCHALLLGNSMSSDAFPHHQIIMEHLQKYEHSLKSALKPPTYNTKVF